MSATHDLRIEPAGPNLLIRFVYFVLIGWWLGGLVSGVAWFLNATIIGLPLGLWIINRLPTIITLRPQEASWEIRGGIVRRGVEQHNFFIRALCFLLIGWWFSGIWLGLAYVAVVSVIGLPIAFWLYNRIGAVTTLYRS
jgi:uncharacterized membrane protein YccF (DUF307 family)